MFLRRKDQRIIDIFFNTPYIYLTRKKKVEIIFFFCKSNLKLIADDIGTPTDQLTMLVNYHDVKSLLIGMLHLLTQIGIAKETFQKLNKVRSYRVHNYL